MIDSNQMAFEDLEEGGAGALELAELEVHFCQICPSKG